MTKSSAEYLRDFRQRMKDKGLKQQVVYIPPEHSKVLKAIEKSLRKGIIPLIPVSQVKERKNTMTKWTNDTLFTALKDTDAVLSGDMIVTNGDTVITVTVEDTQEFPILLSVQNSQILAVTTLLPVESVGDKAADVNEMALRANPVVPLSDFAIIGGNYVLFGALSTESSLDDIITEINTLSGNVVDAVESIFELVNE